jgi:hypothetical protein
MDYFSLLSRDCPKTGGGVHKYLFWAACLCIETKVPDAIAFDLIRQKTRGCGRRVPLGEIQDAIRYAHQKILHHIPYKREASSPEAPRWPKVDTTKRGHIIRHGIGAADLCDLSPSEPDRSAEDFIDLLFPDDPLLCVGKSNSMFATRRRRVLRNHLERLQLIVPSSMSACRGLTKDGKWSEHCRENTGPRTHLVLDFDSGSADDHAALIWFLAQKRPLKMAVHTARRGLHGWFKTAGIPEEALLAFVEEAVSLGADPRMWWKEQFARLPGGWRDDGKAKGRQNVLYFADAV